MPEHNEKKLEKSKYNIEINSFENGNILIFNTLTTSLGLLDEISKKVYNDIEYIDVNKIKDSESLNAINSLASNGFLVEQGLDEYKYYEYMLTKNKFSNKTLDLIIAVTLDCNMSCPYCFETQKNIYMDKENADELIKFIKKYNENSSLEGLKIQWFGGEPLLNLDIIEYLSEHLINYCYENSIKYFASISTNGVLLNKNTAYRLSKCNVSDVYVTMDGPKEIHNKRRILKNKNGSYDIIFKNILECKEILNIIVRSNIDKDNVDSIYDFIDELYENNINFFYRPVSNSHNEDNFEDKTFSQDEFSKIDMCLVKYIHENFGGDINTIYPSLHTGICNANKENCYAIDPSGLLHKCSAFLSEPNKSIGSIYKGITSHCRNTNWIGLEMPSKCKECKKLPVCGTPCPLERINNNNNDIKCPYYALDLESKLDLILTYR